MAAACVALLGTAGCRCSSDTRAPGPTARPSKDAVGLPAHATATDLPAPATASAVTREPRMLVDAEWLLGRAATWLAPRFGSGLAVGRHGLARTRGAAIQHDILDIAKDSIAVEWCGLGLRFERKGRECVVRSGTTVAECPRVVVEETSLLLALAVLSRPQLWSEAAWRIEGMLPQADGIAEVRVASPVLGLRFEVSVRPDGQVTKVVAEGRAALVTEGGKALEVGDAGIWRWEEPVRIPAETGFSVLRIPLSGSLASIIASGVHAVEASNVPTRKDFAEFEFERTPQGAVWRALRLPVDEKAAPPAQKLGPGVVAVHQGATEASGRVVLDLMSGLADVQKTVDSVEIGPGCHVLRLVVADKSSWTSGKPVPYFVQACAP